MTQTLSKQQQKDYLRRLLKARSPFSLSSDKVDQVKNKQYLQLLKSKSKSSISPSLPPLPPQITTTNDGKREILLDAYNLLIRRQPVTEQRLDFELTNLEIDKSKNWIETLWKIIDTLEPTDDKQDTNPIIRAKKILFKSLMTRRKTVQISDSRIWIEKIKNALLRIRNVPNFCELFAPYLNDYNIDSLLSDTGNIGDKRRSDCYFQYTLPFKVRHEKLEELKEYIEKVCFMRANFKYFSELCEIFTVELVDFGSKCPDIIKKCNSLETRLKDAQEKLDADVLEFLKLRIPTRPGLKQKIQQQSKSTTSRATSSLLQRMSQEPDEF